MGHASFLQHMPQHEDSYFLEFEGAQANSAGSHATTNEQSIIDILAGLRRNDSHCIAEDFFSTCLQYRQFSKSKRILSN